MRVRGLEIDMSQKIILRLTCDHPGCTATISYPLVKNEFHIVQDDDARNKLVSSLGWTPHESEDIDYCPAHNEIKPHAHVFDAFDNLVGCAICGKPKE